MQIAPPKIETVPLDKLKPWPKNPRKAHAVDAIARSIEAFGYLAPIIVQKDTYRILAGHGRLEALKKHGITDVPVLVADVDDDRADLYTLADNKITELAEWDFATMADLLLEFDQKNLDVTLTGFTEKELEQIANWTHAGEVEEKDPLPEVPEQAVTQPGDLWELGPHRLLCGDSTKEEDVKRVLGGAIPFLMVTDPPYGVEYDPEWRNEAAEKGAISYAARRVGQVSNDNRVDWSAAYKHFPGDVAYVWHASWFVPDVMYGLTEAGFKPRTLIIWAKPRFAISRGHYHWQHEPCWYAVREGATAKWCGDRSQSTLWEIPLKYDDSDKTHSTQKPLECMARPIRNHGGKGDDIYEPFAGTGTTLIAAHALGRKCFAIEIEPKYADVVVKRWQNFTGLKAKNLTRAGVEIA